MLLVRRSPSITVPLLEICWPLLQGLSRPDSLNERSLRDLKNLKVNFMEQDPESVHFNMLLGYGSALTRLSKDGAGEKLRAVSRDRKKG